jgi:hypothetical protein
MIHVIFYFDPICPWAWRTSLWIREAALVRPLTIEWRLFSLKAINEGHDRIPKIHALSDKPFKVLLAARQEGGNEAIDRLYRTIGEARHDQEKDISDDEILSENLRKAELDIALLQRALDDPNIDDELRREHKEAAARYGAFGVPLLVIHGQQTGFFGPVISSVPTGEDAGLLWDHVSWFLDQPWFYELKRGRK